MLTATADWIYQCSAIGTSLCSMNPCDPTRNSRSSPEPLSLAAPIRMAKCISEGLGLKVETTFGHHPKQRRNLNDKRAMTSFEIV